MGRPFRRYSSQRKRRAMSGNVKRVVVVGGGAAGWIVAGMIAAEHGGAGEDSVDVSLVESPDVPIIGVGEGTWPTMRMTLSKLGVREADFIRACDASFKQGTKFSGWTNGAASDVYYHPFTLPQDYLKTNLASAWLERSGGVPFADCVSPQPRLCDEGLAPKQEATPEYAYVVNYGYHLDAGKFAALLARHCVGVLGVRHLRAHVDRINADESGDIASLSTKEHGDIEGDLFIDCTGVASLLLRKHLGVRFVEQKSVLFADRALAIQAPYAAPDSVIASTTASTAQSAGWVWDIALPTRRGVGYVYSSAHVSDEVAEETLAAYVRADPDLAQDRFAPRKIAFFPGHCETFWRRNCVAVGMAAGFLEPLEASALVLAELSAQMLAENLPRSRDAMDGAAKRFNEKLHYHWRRVIEFLKLHYVLSARDGDFWRDNRRAESVPERLAEALTVWRERAPWKQDFDRVDEIFSAASYQYVLYGMNFKTRERATQRRAENLEQAEAAFGEVERKRAQMLAALPSTRALVEAVRTGGPVFGG